jgi:hypothetical protein
MGVSPAGESSSGTFGIPDLNLKCGRGSVRHPRASAQNEQKRTQREAETVSSVTAGRRRVIIPILRGLGRDLGVDERTEKQSSPRRRASRCALRLILTNLSGALD